MSEEKKNVGASPAAPQEENFSLNDDRRVKVLSPGRLVAQRFLRNRLAILGSVMLIAMFLFSFVGGLVMPYGQDEQFSTYTIMHKEYVGVTRNDAMRYQAAEGQEFGAMPQAKFVLAKNNNQTDFSYKDVDYKLVDEGNEFYSIYVGNTLVAMAYKDIVNTTDGMPELSFNVKYAAMKAMAGGQGSFTADGSSYSLDSDHNIILNGEVMGYISRFVVQSKIPGVDVTRDFKEKLEEALDAGQEEFVYNAGNGGEDEEYRIRYDATAKVWSVEKETRTYVHDSYGRPSLTHPLGLDGAGMDVLTRLMYGGRVSLVIGFIVVIIETVLGVVMGGISGYFGGWVDNLIMRIVDVFYCIPSTPLMIILGAAMDNMKVDPQIRMLYLMLLLGFLGWPGVARMVRGQILSLREQEFMTATEATGVRVSRRIFRHLVPNVMPQLIVTSTMGLGGVILTEATLSFLGLGVKFPFASWGNIISSVNDSYVMANFWYVWIPAGICLLITVLGFNFVGDGLRDAFDPKMKR